MSNDTNGTILSARSDAWNDAVSVRHSRRHFDGSPCDEGKLDRLAEVCTGFRPYADARVELVRDPAVDVFRGIVGSYGRVTQAPHLLVMIASRESAAAQHHAGYCGEAAILEATTAGLDTCWVGGFFSARHVAQLIALEPDERVVAVSPLGRALAEEDASERLLRRIARPRRRHPLEHIAPGISDGWPAWARAGVEAARLAPSAMNRQPWRFRMQDGSLIVAQDSAHETPKVTKALDCGIAMLHAELGALHAGVSGTWHDLGNEQDIARFEPSPER